MKDTIVLVEWEDAAFSSGYYDKKDTASFSPMSTKTAGFLIKSDDKCLIVSHDRFYNEHGKVDTERHITIIPKRMITRIRKLKDIE